MIKKTVFLASKKRRRDKKEEKLIFLFHDFYVVISIIRQLAGHRVRSVIHRRKSKQGMD